MMDFQTTFLFFVLFIMKDVFTTHSTHPATHSGDWINKIFKIDSTVDGVLRKAFASAKYHRVGKFEYNLTHEVGDFKSKIIFYDINFYTHHTDAYNTKPFSLATRKFFDKKIIVSTKFLRITLEGKLRREDGEFYANFFTTLHFDNFELKAIRMSNDFNNEEFFFDISHDSYKVFHHGDQVDIKYSRGELSHEQKYKLTRKIVPILPLLLRVHINRNPEFSEAFEKIDEVFHYASDKISTQVAQFVDIIESKNCRTKIEKKPLDFFTISSRYFAFCKN